MQIPATFVMGATGRLGHVLRRHWAGSAPGIGGGIGGGPVLWGAGEPGPGLTRCDPLGDPAGLARAAGGARALLCLAGITPAAAARGADFGDDARLALAALGAAETVGAHAFVCSSAAVYGRASGTGGLLREDDALTPAAPYGEAKAAMEAAVLERAARTGQGVTILRIGNVAGADAALGGWRPGFTLDAFPDGTTPARSYIGPGMLASVLGALMGALMEARDLPQVLNIAQPGAVEMGALLTAAGLPWATRPAPETAIARVAFETGRLTALVPVPPATPQGLVADWRADQAIG